MRICEIVFSPTGGTRRAADIVAGGLSDDIRTIDLTVRDGEWRGAVCDVDEVAVIAVPSYGGRVPVPAVERLGTVDGGGARAVLVCVYGNRAYEDTLAELADAAAKSGFRTVAAVAAVAEHSIARRYAAGRPDETDARRLEEFARRIADKLSSAEGAEAISLAGGRPYRELKRVGLVPSPSRACNGCGACARRCPVGAIDECDPRRVDEGRCISCMACVAACPKGARRIGRIKAMLVNRMLAKVCSERKECELFI